MKPNRKSVANVLPFVRPAVSKRPRVIRRRRPAPPGLWITIELDGAAVARELRRRDHHKQRFSPHLSRPQKSQREGRELRGTFTKARSSARLAEDRDPFASKPRNTRNARISVF
jgi:hypothetical protein